ncbi:MAG TPA: hypothetical protein VF363_12575 [Candidatus Eisenbacteria bacterium]
MAAHSVLTDELVKQLIAVGQVDVLVALPTFHNASSAAGAARAAVLGLARHFPRARSALLHVDGGSSDGTPDIVLRASGPDLDREIRAQTLRTIQRISAPYDGLPTKATALRAVFASADLLQARAIAVLDPTVTSVTPEWIAALIGPVLRDRRDFVAPVHQRHPLDAPLASQLVRPLVRAVYARRIEEPVAGEFGCSGAFVTRCLADAIWDREMAPLGVDASLSLAALAGPFDVCQASLGPRVTAPDAPRPALADVFRQVVGSIFACMEAQQSAWITRDGAQEVPLAGEAPASLADTTPLEAAPLVEGYRSGLRDLGDLLAPILEGGTLAALREAAASDPLAFRVEDSIWVATVYEFAAAYHRQVIHRDHLVQALVPLYLGRAASFLLECVGKDLAEIASRADALALEFETMKPHLLRHWEPNHGGES